MLTTFFTKSGRQKPPVSYNQTINQNTFL